MLLTQLDSYARKMESSMTNEVDTASDYVMLKPKGMEITAFNSNITSPHVGLSSPMGSMPGSSKRNCKTKFTMI